MGYGYWYKVTRLLRAITLLALIHGPGSGFWVTTMSDEKRLTKYILENYERVGRVGRPVWNSSEVIEVAVGLSLVRVNEVDTQRQTMDSLAWLTMEYTDNLLRWQSDDFGGADRLVVPVSGVWTPDIVLLNAVAPTEPIYDTWATVQPDGHVHYSAYYHFRSLCQVTDDSSERLECPLSVGSWIHSTNYMAITANDRADAESYRANPDFMLISALSTTRERTCDCAPGETFSEVTYTISLERRNKESIWGVAGSNAVTSTSAVTIASLIAAITAVLLMTSA